jgi:4-diphosphocytidyl-2-C-methyl-D-erythritol kinase
LSSSARPVRAAAVALEAPAKVNLALRILEREPSGYHRLETYFQTLELADRVLVELRDAEGITLEVSGEDAGPVSDNLVVRAARAFTEEARVDPALHIRLEKRIPAGAGLGGGSSDAAATLRALADLLGELPGERFGELAAALGSDVPFFLCGSPLALGSGRGERLTPLTPLPSAPVILALPRVHVSTAAAYAALDRRREQAGRGQSSSSAKAPAPLTAELSSWESVERLAHNDFEALVCADHPEVARARDALRATGARFVLLSGSGAAVFAVYRTEEDAAAALKQLPKEGTTRYVRTRTAGVVPAPQTFGRTQPRG